MAIVKDIIEIMEYIAPSWMCCKGDVAGLQAGSVNDSVKKILVALDATEKVIKYAAQKKCQMIITHHPRFYKPLANVCRDTFAGNIAFQLCKTNIALFNAHTNFDVAPGGVNDILADIAGLVDETPVDAYINDSIIKLSVYVPDESIAAVRDAVCEAGAGEIGNYSECAYQTIGAGSFRPLEGANPAIGEIGELTEIEEWKLEVVLPESLLNNVKQALLDAHPYETPAYEFVKIIASNKYGQGRVGMLKNPTTLLALARKFKKATNSHSTQIVEGRSEKFRRVAVWSGSGVNTDKIIRSGAECVVCGELGYHMAEELSYHGIAAVVLGHGPCEDIALKVLVDSLLSGIEKVEVLQAPRLWPDYKNI